MSKLSTSSMLRFVNDIRSSISLGSLAPQESIQLNVTEYPNEDSTIVSLEFWTMMVLVI